MTCISNNEMNPKLGHTRFLHPVSLKYEAQLTVGTPVNPALKNIYTDGHCHLRSAISGQLSVPSTTMNYDDRSFAVSGPVMWNSLPAALRLNMSLSVFHRQLKTFFMTEATDSV